MLNALVLTLQIALALTISRYAEKAITAAAKGFWNRVVLWAWAVVAMKG